VPALGLAYAGVALASPSRRWPVPSPVWRALLDAVTPSLLNEIRDWLETVATGISLYLSWRWRPRRDRHDVTIKVPPATARAVIPTPGDPEPLARPGDQQRQHGPDDRHLRLAPSRPRLDGGSLPLRVPVELAGQRQRVSPHLLHLAV
jgi:hypothetical protein